jgi:uncharacterized protein
VRLGLQGEELLMEGKLTLPMKPAHREAVLKVRTGGYTLAQVSEVIIDSENRLQTAFDKSPLRLWPDRAFVQQWMMRTYTEAWKAHDLSFAWAADDQQRAG